MSNLSKPHKSTYTLEKAATVIDLLKKGKGAAHAADAVNVTRKTLYNWQDQFPNFKAQWDDTQEGVTDGIEQTAIEKALAGDTTMLIFMLKSRRRALYAERVEHTGENGSPLTILITERKDGPA